MHLQIHLHKTLFKGGNYSQKYGSFFISLVYDNKAHFLTEKKVRMIKIIGLENQT